MAMAIKQGALVSRMHGGSPDAFAHRMLDNLFQYHGMAVGHFTGDECVMGDSPVQGSELCSVVEAMYSYEQLLSISGDPALGRLSGAAGLQRPARHHQCRHVDAPVRPADQSGALRAACLRIT